MHGMPSDRTGGRPPSRALSNSNYSGQTDGAPTPPMSPINFSDLLGIAPFVPHGTR